MRKTVAAAVLSMLVAGVAAAAPIGPGYPPPGGVTWSGSGAGPGQTGGMTWSYSGLSQPGNFSSLWWGPTAATTGPLTSSGTGSNSQPVTGWSQIGLNNNQAALLFSNPWFIDLAMTADISVPVRILLTVTDLSDNPVGLIDAISVPGISGAVGPLLDVVGSGLVTTGFKANFEYQAYYGGWIATDTFFNTLQTTCTGCVLKSFSAGFWHEPPVAVPEPATQLILGTSLLGLACRLRRRRP